jgi:hypothetical protein
MLQLRTKGLLAMSWRQECHELPGLEKNKE